MNTDDTHRLRNSKSASTLDAGRSGPLLSVDAPPEQADCPAMSTILLLVISIVAPWTVHLAPPRQRALALVGVVAVYLLYGIFAENPLTQWEMWAGPRGGRS